MGITRTTVQLTYVVSPRPQTSLPPAPAPEASLNPNQRAGSSNTVVTIAATFGAIISALLFGRRLRSCLNYGMLYLQCSLGACPALSTL